MEKPSIKNASTTDIEAAIAQALAGLTGWDSCTVAVKLAAFSGERLSGGESVDLTITAVFSPNYSDPF